MQGVGAGTLAPIALATTALVFPPAQRGLGLALMAMIANVAAALGPPIGGVLVEFAGWPLDAGWHWIFLINVPIGVLGIALALRDVAGDTRPARRHQCGLVGDDDAGRRRSSASPSALVEANDWGWGSPRIVALFVGAGVLTLAFALTQRFGKRSDA